MNNKITDTINKFNMVSGGDTVLLAVSGGADSMLMLDYFYNNQKALDISIKVAHIEHGIRGQSSLDDAKFIESYCKERNIEFNLLSINAVDEAKQLGIGVEEYSRNRRYEFFDTIPCDKIATAHSLTDNIETILFRLARGTGIKGLCGIPAVRGKIIRPLIELTSKEIRDFCNGNDIPYRIDETNFDNEYKRNLIRNGILPLLGDVNCDYEQKFAEFINDVNEDYELIDELADRAYESALIDNKLLLRELIKYKPSIQKRIIVKYFTGNGITLSRFHINQITHLIYKNGKIQIKGTFFAVSDKNYLRFADLSNKENSFCFVSQILNINEFSAENIDFSCDCDKIVGNVIIRKRKPGDEITIANRNCTKSLKKLFNEMSIPIELRDSVGVICDDLGVIGLTYNGRFDVAKRVRVDESTEKIFTIKIPLED